MIRTRTDLIVIHSSATPAHLDVGAAEIDRWHRAEGFLKIGYHFVIRRNGAVEPGRDLQEVGAHARPHNVDSVGICMVGGVADDGKTPQANFTHDQWGALEKTVKQVLETYPGADVIGHRDVPGTPPTACPSFDVRPWWVGVNAIS